LPGKIPRPDCRTQRRVGTGPKRCPRPPRRANYFLISVADSPRIRHSCEKFAISFENLQPSCRFSKSVADDDASSCAFAEFSSKWRTSFSHLRGGSENRTVVQDLGRCFVIRAIVEALTGPWTSRLPRGRTGQGCRTAHRRARRRLTDITDPLVPCNKAFGIESDARGLLRHLEKIGERRGEDSPKTP
jgi:hypothetical protein